MHSFWLLWINAIGMLISPTVTDLCISPSCSVHESDTEVLDLCTLGSLRFIIVSHPHVLDWISTLMLSSFDALLSLGLTHCSFFYSFKDIFSLYFYFICMGACMSVHHVHSVSSEARKREFPGTGVRDYFELPCGCWASKLCSLDEQPVLLLSELSLQPPCLFFNLLLFSGI